MRPAKQIQIADKARSELMAVARQLSSREKEQLGHLLPAFASKARSLAEHWDFAAPSRIVDQLLTDPCAFPDSPDIERLRRVVVARLALDHFEVEDRLPSSIVALYPKFFDRLVTFLSTRACYSYPHEYYSKDVRYALGLTVPCGTHQLDLRNRVGPKLILRDVIASRSVNSALAYAACRGWGRWYANHLDLRAMKEFNSDGWTASFVRMAEALKLNPDVRGVAGVSWFHDPRVRDISPHLGYIQTPTSFGAFLANMGSAPHHIANATVRSSTRQKLYEEGKYSPTCYLLAWPRNALIAWAERLKDDPSATFRNSRLASRTRFDPVQASPPTAIQAMRR
jgi:hypothetical protein